MSAMSEHATNVVCAAMVARGIPTDDEAAFWGLMSDLLDDRLDMEVAS
jgi:hypothetical protein